jgi:hypothetical protein
MIVPFFKTALAAKRPSVKDFEVEPTEKKVILEQTSIDN